MMETKQTTSLISDDSSVPNSFDMSPVFRSAVPQSDIPPLPSLFTPESLKGEPFMHASPSLNMKDPFNEESNPFICSSANKIKEKKKIVKLFSISGEEDNEEEEDLVTFILFFYGKAIRLLFQALSIPELCLKFNCKNISEILVWFLR